MSEGNIIGKIQSLVVTAHNIVISSYKNKIHYFQIFHILVQGKFEYRSLFSKH